jgi:acyl phosphate:glycerol-3-phosphate acyltransferase
MGALNIARELGPGWGLAVLLIDMAKGAGAITIARALGVPQLWVFATGLAAIVGHCWPVFLLFKGGKGAATAIGVFLALSPREFGCSIPILLAVIFLTSNVTLGMAVGIIFFPLFLWIFGQPLSVIIYVVIVGLFLVLRYAPTAKRGIAKSRNIKDFLIEKNYKPWQSRRRP